MMFDVLDRLHELVTNHLAHFLFAWFIGD